MTNPKSKPTRSSRYPIFIALAWCAAVGGLGVVLPAALWHDGLGRASGTWLTLHYLAFMCQTFAYHAGLAMLPTLLIAAIARRKWLALITAFAFAVGTGPELWTARPNFQSQSDRPTLKIMSINLMVGQSDTATLLSQIQREAPDVIVFQEWTPGDAAALGPALATAFPHRIDQPRDDAFGQAVFSRCTFVEEPRVYPPQTGFREPQISIAIDHDSKTMRITNVHLLPPVSGSYFNQQRVNAAAFAAWQADLTRSDRPDVLAGDFNATLRSGIVGAITSAGMSDAQREAGWWRGSTWPRLGTLACVPGLQLDHVLFGPRIECEESHVGEDFGSDHRPVIARLRWK